MLMVVPLQNDFDSVKQDVLNNRATLHAIEGHGFLITKIEGKEIELVAGIGKDMMPVINWFKSFVKSRDMILIIKSRINKLIKIWVKNGFNIVGNDGDLTIVKYGDKNG